MIRTDSAPFGTSPADSDAPETTAPAVGVALQDPIEHERAVALLAHAGFRVQALDPAGGWPVAPPVVVVDFDAHEGVLETVGALESTPAVVAGVDDNARLQGVFDAVRGTPGVLVSDVLSGSTLTVLVFDSNGHLRTLVGPARSEVIEPLRALKRSATASALRVPDVPVSGDVHLRIPGGDVLTLHGGLALRPDGGRMVWGQPRPPGARAGGGNSARQHAVAHAVDGLDDPTTALLASVDSLLDDHESGDLDGETLRQVLGDCALAAVRLQAGIRRLKAVALPEAEASCGVVSLDQVFLDVVRSSDLSGVCLALPDAPAGPVWSSRGALAHGLHALLSVLLEGIDGQLVPPPAVTIDLRDLGNVVMVDIFGNGLGLEAEVVQALSGAKRASSRWGLITLGAQTSLERVGAAVTVRSGGRGFRVRIPRRAPVSSTSTDG